MISATKKWIFLKISGAILIPLMLWFVLNLISIYDQQFIEVKSFFTTSLSKFLNLSKEAAQGLNNIVC